MPAKPDRIAGTAALVAFLVDSWSAPRSEHSFPSTSPENNKSRMTLTRFITDSFRVSDGLAESGARVRRPRGLGRRRSKPTPSDWLPCHATEAGQGAVESLQENLSCRLTWLLERISASCHASEALSGRD